MAFCKARIVSELTLTLIRKALIESKHKLVFKHSPQTLTTKVIRKLYPRNTEHIRKNLRCESNVRTSNVSDKMKY